MKTILLAGATGLVGQTVLDQFDSERLKVITVGRQATGRVSEEIVTDFLSPFDTAGADVAICALGTTMAKAGSKSAFRAVDHDAVITFAQAAHDAGIPHFAVVTAVGANPRSRVFYSRVKGETERDLQTLGFRRLDIVQPGLLLGKRHERRIVEEWMQTLSPFMRRFFLGPLSHYAGIDASAVGRALLAICDETEPGIFYHKNRALQRFS